MPITRDLSNNRVLTDWTDDIVNMPTLNGMINARGMFSEVGTSEKSITFTKDFRDFTLLPASDRVLKDQSAGKPRTWKTYSLALPYFNHKDTLTVEDLQFWREYNDPDMAASKVRAKAAKLSDMRTRADQTKEYMKMSALKGVTVDPSGNTLADMFTEFGETQDSIDFLFGTSTDVTASIHTVLRTLSANNQTGMPITMPTVLCGNEFFDKLVKHADVAAAYSTFKSTDGIERLRDNLFDFTQWGAYGVFTHRGMRFVNYEPTFTLPDGTSVKPIATEDGYLIHTAAKGLYRGFNGPTSKFSTFGAVGAPLHTYEWPRDRDDGFDFELEMAPLYYMTNPKMSIKVTTSN